MKLKRELFLVIVIILCVIWFDLVCNNHFMVYKNDLENKLISIEENLNEFKDEKYIVKELYDKWFEFEEKASYYVEHDELEKVSLKVSVLKKSYDNDQFEDIKKDIEEIRFLINHIYEKDKLKLKNIF